MFEFASEPKHNLPPKTQSFIGRVDTLSKIKQNFKTANTQSCVKQTIFGLGGFGKTEIALEYARTHTAYYTNGIGYINAGTMQSIKASFAEFAKTVCNITATDDHLKSAISHWLNSRTAWLLILDNADDIEEDAHKALLSYLTSLQTGHVLLTTRNSKLILGEPVYIEVFTDKDALTFMQNRLSEQFCTDCHSSTWAKIAWRLGYLPLALEQAVAFISNSGGINFEEYDHLLDEYGIALFDDSLSVPRDCKRTITTTFELSFNRLSVGTKHFLNICAFLAPERIPLNFFQTHWTKFSETLADVLSQEMGLIKIRAELMQFHLINNAGDTISIHRLVQEAIRKNLEDDTTRWLTYCISAMEKEVPSLYELNDPHTLEKFSTIVTHAASLMTHIRDIVKKYIGGKEYVKFANLFQQELMIYMKFLGLAHTPEILKAIDIYLRMARENFIRRSLLSNPNRRAAIAHYKKGNLVDALEHLMEDVLDHTDISRLYPNMPDALDKLKCAYDLCKIALDGSPYPAAIQLMINYIEDELKSCGLAE